MSLSLLFVFTAIILLVWIGLKYATPRGSPIAPDDPLWAAAVQRARATVPDMLQHQQSGRDVWVKFPMRTKAGATEHVWGRVSEMRGHTLQCIVETPPAGHPARGLVMTEITTAEIEDWQVELEDGTIRGGFTTRAQAEMARRDGQSVPPHIEDMIRRMTN
jgi:hypothetical protein